ncbi:MAG: DUF6443 domain-containing protein [Chitinophagaceae bacterium]
MTTGFIFRVKFLSGALLAALVSYSQVTPPAGYGAGLKPGYVRSREVLAPLKDPVLVGSLPVGALRQSTTYVDGLGRPLQTVLRQASRAGSGAATDLVTAVVHDPMGRQTYHYLPFASGSDQGGFKTDPFWEQAAFYDRQLHDQGERYYYGRTTYEASPLNRVLSTYAAGNSWAGSEPEALAADRHGVEMSYLVQEGSDQVKSWKVAGNSIYAQGDYAPGQLSETLTLDEDRKKVVEYKDQEGKMVLKKVQLSGHPSPGHEGWLCTYYVYDELGLLRLVIQPRAVEELARPAVNWQLSTLLLEEQCFQYSYDSRRLMITKKVPGAGQIRMVHDSRDRLVMTQDANLRKDHQWLYTHYDDLNRPLATGLLSDPVHFEDHAYHLQHARASSSYPYPGSYTTVELSRSFYDGYEWLGKYPTPFGSWRATSHEGYLLPSSPTSFPYAEGVVQSGSVRGLVTGTRTKVLGRDDYLYSITYYDDKGRVIQAGSTNLSGGVDVTTTQYSHSGMVLLQIAVGQKGGTDPQEHTVITETAYDELWRVATLSKTVISTRGGETVTKPRQVIVRNGYDALGRLSDKTLGHSSHSDDGLEKLSYGYNIRGWLRGVNSHSLREGSSSHHWFGMELGYDKGIAGAGGGPGKPQFNGNISRAVWQSRGDGVKRQYDFAYDEANRLLKGDYQQREANGSWGSATMNFSMRMGDGIDPTTAYDANGNIKAMSQQGWRAANPGAELDKLEYSYLLGGLSNKLREVKDGSALGSGGSDFRDGNHDGSDDYSYDDNGNLTGDRNKAISRISYNHLNLPGQITILQQDVLREKGRITYTYDALGNKLSKETLDRTVTPQKTTTTLYLGAMVYQDDELQFISHEEGRIRFEKAGGGSCSTQGARLEYDYFIRDHLGNIRMVLTEQKAVDCYPAAGLEKANLAREQQVYDIKEGQVEDLAADVKERHPGLQDRAYRVVNAAGEKTGLGMVLKVMAGDEVMIRAESVYMPPVEQAGAGSTGAVVLGELLSGFLSSAGAAVKGGPGADILAGSAVAGPLNAFIHDPRRSTPAAVPRAYLNYIHFDGQLNYVDGGFERVNDYDNTGYRNHDRFTGSPVKITKNGYLYIYVSNESELKVLFDNLQVTHVRGPLLEETHYYPFGLTMEGISSKAAGGVENRRGFNGNELQSTEFSDGSGLNVYDFNARTYDPQIGRFIQLDPKSEEADQESWSPYHFSYNNPVRYNDPDGRLPIIPIIWGLYELGSAIYDGYQAYKTVSDKNASNGEKAAAVGGVLLSAVLPGGGYGTAAKATVRAVDKADDALKATDKISDGSKMAKALEKAETAVKGTKGNNSGATDFVVNSKGEAVAIPNGAKGPSSPNKGTGMSYQGGNGGKGMDKKTTGVRIMDANSNQGRRVNYMNKSGQTVDNKTGKTIPNKDSRGHMPYGN